MRAGEDHPSSSLRRNPHLRGCRLGHARVIGYHALPAAAIERKCNGQAGVGQLTPLTSQQAAPTPTPPGQPATSPASTSPSAGQPPTRARSSPKRSARRITRCSRSAMSRTVMRSPADSSTSARAPAPTCTPDNPVGRSPASRRALRASSLSRTSHRLQREARQPRYRFRHRRQGQHSDRSDRRHGCPSCHAGSEPESHKTAPRRPPSARQSPPQPADNLR